mmetsp:Transcript_23769/g.76384  ORF Transcript_23769/g.76384 Transcript_23769/m.76384 type:complete len:86 (-) Transcript_23769:227-484(-)
MNDMNQSRHQPSKQAIIGKQVVVARTLFLSFFFFFLRTVRTNCSTTAGPPPTHLLDYLANKQTNKQTTSYNKNLEIHYSLSRVSM